MRALFCTDTYPPQINGVSVVTSLSVMGLRARGWNCAVIAPKYPSSERTVFDPSIHGQVTGLPSVAMPTYPDIRIAAPDYQVVADVIASFKPDIVHCQTEFVIGRMGQIAAKRAGIPLVSSYHTDFGRYTKAYGMPWLTSTVTSYVARFHSRSVRVYTPSAPARQDLLHAGVRNVEVWGRGVDTTQFTPNRRSQGLRESYGLGYKHVFLHVGRLAAEKGVERIIEAFSIARRLLPANSTHLVIAGAGPMDDALRAAAPPDVTFLGRLDRQNFLPDLYASCDTFVFASLTETLGLVILEAMASGLPVIAAPAGGVADHLRHGVNGLAYPAADIDAMAHAMVDIAMHSDRHAHLATGAIETAKHLSWESELERLDESYREVCGAGPSTVEAAA